MATCSFCSKQINGSEIFGEHDQPACWNCWSGLLAEEASQIVYGLGPHHHDLSKTGSFIGSTVFEALPDKDEFGRYDMGDAFFTPDPDAPGLGIWEYKAAPGWRRS